MTLHLPSLRRRRPYQRFGGVLVLAALLLGACGDPQEKQARYLAEGKALFEKGDYAGAQVQFRNVVQLNPKSADALVHLAQIAEKQGDPQAAYRSYQRVVEEQLDNVLAQAKLGQFYVVSRDLPRARAQAELAHRLDPEHPELLLLRALIALEAGDLAEADARTAAVLAKDPGKIDAAALLARIRERSGGIDAALAAFDQTLTRQPKDVTLRTFKVQMLERANRGDQAVAVYREMIAIEPAVYVHRAGLSRLLYRIGAKADAEQEVRQAIAERIGTTAAKLGLIDLLLSENRTDDAEAELKRMIEATPDEHALRFRLAELYARLQKLDPAEAALGAIVRRDREGENGVAARLALARLAYARNAPEKGDALIADALTVDKDNGEALKLRAARSLDGENAEQAIIDLRTVLRGAPNDGAATRLLARAYVAAGKPDLAEQQLARLVKLDAEDAGAKYGLAYFQAQRGQTEQALELLDEILKGRPAAAAPLRAKAALLIAERNWPAAEAAIAQLKAVPEEKATAFFLTGVMELARRQPAAARAALEQARALAPAAPGPVVGIVRSYLAERNIDGAARFLEQAATAAPDNAFLQTALGDVRLGQGKPGAGEAFERAKALKPDWPVPYLGLARVQLAAAQPQAAIAALDAGLAAVPANPVLLRGKADAQLIGGDPKGAIATYLQLVSLRPDNDEAANNAAALIATYAYDNPASFERARTLIRRLERSPDSHHLDTVGWVRYRAGEFGQARDALEQAVRRRPDAPELHYHLGMTLYRLGETEAARQALEKATRAGADYPGIEEARATLAGLAGAGSDIVVPR
jgi:predicted Zn-dependent protease